MDSRFFRFVWRYSKKDQLIILGLTLLSFPLVYLSLEIPKIIINQAISGTDFPKDILGFAVTQIPYLFLLCGVYLLLVVAINGIKWVMNVQIGMTGERMLRRLRYMLFERVLRFRMVRFRSTKPGEVIQSIIGEIEPLGGFIGEVIATPAFQGGLLCVYMTFIFVQDWVLGLAAISLYPIQAILVPILQKKIVRLNRERAANTRLLADTVGETVGVIADVHTNDTARWHLAQVAGRLYQNTRIRLELFKRKFTIKFVNNFMNHLTPFFFYSAGGYLVIKGDLDFGSLVAVLAAYKDVAAPWKAVLNYVQRWADFNSRYVFVVENFSGEDVLSETRLYPDEDAVPLSGALAFSRVEGGPGTGGLTVTSLEIAPGEMIAVTGGESGAREALLRMAAGLMTPHQGHVTLGGKTIVEATLPEVGAALAYVGSEPGIVQNSIRANLLYGLFRGAPDLADEKTAALADMLREAEMTGNTTANPTGEWVEPTIAGVADRAALEDRLLSLIDAVSLSDELYSSALAGRLDPERAEAWTGPIAEARTMLRKTLPDANDLVEDWDPDRYNMNAPIIENVLYGLPVIACENPAEHADQPLVVDALDRIGARTVLIEIGLDIAREFSEIVETVEPTSTVLDSLPGYARTEVLAAHDLIVAEANQSRSRSAENELLLIKLALPYIDVRDGLDVLDDARIEQLLACRAKARETLAGSEHFVLFDEDRFSPGRSIAGNILHGKRRYDRRSAWRALDERIKEAVDDAGLHDDLIRLGLSRPVATAGLSGSTKRKIALVRGLLKNPHLLILDGIAGSDSDDDAGLRQTIREAVPEAIIVYAATDEPEALEIADRVINIDKGGTADCAPAAESATLAKRDGLATEDGG